jgi:hypothetical protein
MTFTTVDTASPDAKVKRDQWGRYRIPHPDTGKEQSWTRATTLANTLADRYGLEQWAKRNVVLGIGARSDLYAQAASCTVDDKDQLTLIVNQAEEAAASKAKANLGTALHRFTERIDAGESIDVPDPWRADVDAYTATMAAHGIVIVPGWIERILVVPEIDAAGMCDRLCNALWPLPRIGDLKTGADVIRYGMTEIALQEAIYAHASHWYDPTTGELHPMPRIDQDKALVMHLPVGKATCTLYEVDIRAGWEAVQLAVDVRKWRQRKDLAQIHVPTSTTGNHQQQRTSSGLAEQALSRETGGQPATGSAASDTRTEDEPVAGPTPDEKQAYLDHLDRTEWVRDRVQAIKDAGHASSLAALWSQHPYIPTFPKGGPRTPGELSIVIALCDQVEAEHNMPFGVSDPTAPQVTKATLTKRDTTNA